MSRIAVALLGATVVTAVTGVTTVAIAREQGWTLPRLLRSDRPAGPVTVVLNRHGGLVVAAEDDSSRLGYSGILERQGVASVEIPAFRGSDAEWDELRRCVQERFDGLGVDVVDEVPATGAYTVAHVGGTPDLLGFAETVGGIAPHADRVLEGSVVFVFQPQGVEARSLCETVAHEVGHTLGLDHTRECSDIMSYETCGPKEFRVVSSGCGEWEDRDCEDGNAEQSSWQRLVAAVGERPRRFVVEEETPPEPAVSSERPTLAVQRSAQAIAGQEFSVYVDVGDADVREVDLFWYGRRGVRLRCGEQNEAVPFACRREGSTYVFTLTAEKAGARKFVARVEDGKGRLTKTPVYRVTFERG
ncbi:matrixin family metalloprotease [Paraliomyxa miuraensis]|uniref:matrixin family metalloprotease n=1 Tax=Paraliomyxa miuraensis TaxID=376150 RepID=UPI00225666D8|nr:matrixin family metalloprotease [Paraliomyxa miuraensis]MCX4247073.1 hypothetical protein [Paraliomyxa miuraensis]